MSLRDAVKRLSPNPKNLEYSKLLGLLEGGPWSRRGFGFQHLTRCGLEIRREFWLNVDAAKFSSQLRFDRKKALKWNLQD